MKISKRLKSLAFFIDNGDSVADIGCDHALLDIYLVKNNIVNKTLACDINENALNSGISNIKKYHLEDKIKTTCMNGIENIPKDINTLIISGMGTNTIIKILSHNNIKQINKLIIQSNNDYFELRKYLTTNNFYIKDENVIYDQGKYYINIMFLKGNKKYSKKELKYGPILMHNNPDYFKYLYNTNLEILNKIPKNKILLRLKIIKNNFYLKKLKKK